jgi:hypothetical protein
MEKSQQGIKTIIIIDEAQNLPKDTLEELRMLSNLETDRDKLIQIILVGQLELEERLKYDELKQLAQRISIRYRLTPLTREETGAYVRHRLEVAGDGSSIKFMPRVLSRIHDLSKGIPRRINLICERALMAAYVDDEMKVSRKHLVRAIRSIEGEGDRISTVPVWLWPAIGCVVLIFATAWFAYQYKPKMALQSDITQPPQVAQVEKPAAVEQPIIQKSVSSSQDQSSAPSVSNLQPEVSPPTPIDKSSIQVNARVLPEPSPVPNSELKDPSVSSFQDQASSPESIASAPHPSPLTPKPPGAEAPVLRRPPGERVESLDEKKEAAPEPVTSNSKFGQSSAVTYADTTQNSELKDPSVSSPQDQASSPESIASAPHPSPLTPNPPGAEAPVLRLPPGERVESLDEMKEVVSLQPDVSTPAPLALSPEPLLLPIDEYYLTVDRDRNIAELWQGTAGGPLLRHHFKLDWRIMEGLYILGNDKQKGAFIFNPTLFQWGGYKLLNASALWSQVSGFVKDALIPVVVYSGNKLDKELLTEESLFIQKMVNTWADTWRNKDIKELMGFYSKTFSSYDINNESPRTYSKHELAEIRGRILATSSSITLLTSTPICIIDPQNSDLAIAVFKQEYNSNTYADQGIKVLYLRREGNYPEQPWKIVAKFFLPSE